MPESVFHFKRFVIQQDRSAMKVGTDGVLLGAWVNTEKASHTLDIGTGTGLITLMLAQRSSATIDAIEIDRESFEQAQANVLMSPWYDRIRVVHASLQEFKPVLRYDLIVSNPPYFIDSFAAVDEARNRARQASASLSYDELLNGVIRLLHISGRFCVILPSKEGQLFLEKAAQNGLFCNRMTHVLTRSGKEAKRVLMEFSRNEAELVEDEIVLRNEDLSFTDAYKTLTREYYTVFE
jgi:tRNA1Val (adenine37-N6)-methyltransferase